MPHAASPSATPVHVVWRAAERANAQAVRANAQAVKAAERQRREAEKAQREAYLQSRLDDASRLTSKAGWMSACLTGQE